MFRAGMAANQTHALLAEVYDLPQVSANSSTSAAATVACSLLS